MSRTTSPAFPTRIAALLALLLGMSPPAASAATLALAAPDGTQDGQADAAVADAPLAAWQSGLLELAFRSASAMPLMPHVRNRSRSQAEVVEACLELDQPQRARTWADAIANWQRGEAYAELAVWAARHDRSADVAAELAVAQQVADAPGDDTYQDWQRARIRARIAEAHILLGEAEAAAKFARDLEPSERVHVQVARAEVADEADFDALLAGLDTAITAGDLDGVKGALQACTQLYARSYDDAERRARIEKKLPEAFRKIPRDLGIRTLLDLADIALQHADREHALALAGQAQEILDAANWVPEDKVPLMAAIAGRRGRAGDVEGARGQVAEALALFEREQRTIANVFRAGVLRPVAEACQDFGDTQAALSIYAKAVEAGVENPNSRPRAEDLVATCYSMALHGVQPDEQLSARMTAIADALGDPW